MSAQDVTQQVTALTQKLTQTPIPQELKDRALSRLDRLSKVDSSSVFDELEHLGNYIDWITTLPWDKRTGDILDLEYARAALDKNHFGLGDIKDRVLEFVSVMKLNQQKGLKSEKLARAPILCFVGLVGTGKTTVAYSVAEALGRQIARVPFGGMGGPLDLRGQSRVHPEAEPGQIMKALRKVGTKNPVILLDEIDRVSEEGRSSIMGVLVELLDPEQNSAFLDYYVDYPFNLSEVMFIATANNTTNIATAVLDRLEVTHMPSYTDEEKITIAKSYMLPRVLNESGLPREVLVFKDEVWPLIVRPLGYDAGMRTLERTIEGIVRKVAREYVEGKTKQLALTPENIKAYLPSY
ncbi:MAG: AAA family ATPase [Candidatus Blackburnbacteria bacterium]|nr:AAA family ATPase [Candidatus Blackburnbacteria bacterium]